MHSATRMPRDVDRTRRAARTSAAATPGRRGCGPGDHVLQQRDVGDACAPSGRRRSSVSELNGGMPGTRPNGGLKPTTPQNDAGMRIEPPMSDPVASMVAPAASAAPEPPDEPPGVIVGVPRVARDAPQLGVRQRRAARTPASSSGRARRRRPRRRAPPSGASRPRRCPSPAGSPPRSCRPAIGCSSLSSSGMPVERQQISVALRRTAPRTREPRRAPRRASARSAR